MTANETTMPGILLLLPAAVCQVIATLFAARLIKDLRTGAMPWRSARIAFGAVIFAITQNAAAIACWGALS